VCCVLVEDERLTDDDDESQLTVEATMHDVDAVARFGDNIDAIFGTGHRGGGDGDDGDG
jgi:hypothetical protein